METEIITRGITIDTEFGELAAIPAKINLSNIEAEIVSAEFAGGPLHRDALIKLAGNAEVERIESDLFDEAVDLGLVDTFDRHEEQRKEYMAGTGYPFGPLAGHF